VFSSTYFSSTEAPASSSFVLTSSASDLDTPSLIALGALSTSSLASFKPKLVRVRTTLITLIFDEPEDVNTTSKLSFSSAAVSPPPAGAAATAATGAAAVIPNFSSISLTSSRFPSCWRFQDRLAHRLF